MSPRRTGILEKSKPGARDKENPRGRRAASHAGRDARVSRTLCPPCGLGADTRAGFPCPGRAPRPHAVPPLRVAAPKPPRRHHLATPPRRPSAALYGSAAVSRRARTEEVTERRRRRRGSGSGSGSSSSMWRVLARRVARGAAGAPAPVRSCRAFSAARAGRGAAGGVGAVPLGRGPAWNGPVPRPGGLLQPAAWPRLVPCRCCSLPAHQKVRGSPPSPIPCSPGAPISAAAGAPIAAGVPSPPPPHGSAFPLCSRVLLPLAGRLNLHPGAAVLCPLLRF